LRIRLTYALFPYTTLFRSISFVSNDFQTVEQHIYEAVNGGDLGSVTQSMFFDDQGRAYIISNGSNFVTVVDRYTFEKIDRIEGDFNMPRYGAVANGKAFVTNAGADYISVIDLETLKVESTIDIGNISEYIYKSDDGKLYIQNAAYGTGNHITVLDPLAGAVEATIDTEDRSEEHTSELQSRFDIV